MKRLKKVTGTVLLVMNLIWLLLSCSREPIPLEPMVVPKEPPLADLAEAPGESPDAALEAEAEALFASAIRVNPTCAAFVPDGAGVRLVSYAGPTDVTALILPATVDGKPVTGIAPGVLAGCGDLIALSTPLPGSVTLAVLFDEREVPDPLRVPSALRFLTVEGNMPDFAARGCRSLARVELKNADRLGNYALWGCLSLQSAVLPTGLTYVGEEALAHTALAALTLPAQLEECGLGALHGCESLRELTMPALSEMYLGFVFGARDVIWSADFIPKDLWSVTLTGGNGTTDLPAYALTGCPARFVNLSDGLKCIGIRAFSDCGNLRRIVLPSTLETVGDDAFFGDARLQKIVFPDTLTRIGDRAFYGCSSLTTVTLPDHTVSIGSLAFAGCPVDPTHNDP